MPYKGPDELRQALVQAGSIEALARKEAASPNTVRRWCAEAGVETATGNIGRPIECPFTAEQLQERLEAAGGVKALAEQLGRDDKTVRKWMLKLGLRAPKPGRVTGGGFVLERTNDAELEALASALGINRLASVLNLSVKAVSDELKKRNITPRSAANPRITMLSRRVRDLERQEAAVADLADAVKGAAEECPMPSPPARKRRAAGTQHHPVDVILHVVDVQYGMVVDPDEVAGGGFSPDIVDQERMPRYLEAVEGILRATTSTSPLGTVWLAMGGDLVEGEDVFKGQAWHLAIDAGEQVVRFGRLWAQSAAHIAGLVKELGGHTVMLSVVGNHGVHGGRSAGAVPPALSYDHLAYALSCEALRPTAAKLNLTMHEDAQRARYFEVCGGRTVLLTHGDQDRGGGLVGVPVVTGLRNDLSVRLSTDIQHDLHLSGHYHRPTGITVGGDAERLWSGAWVGSTNLSTGRGGASLPSQQVIVMHPEYGLSALHRIRLVRNRTESPVEVTTA
jgi:hypothetical protein